MNVSTIFFLVIAVIFLALIFNLLRSRKLREKYAALWLLVGLLIVVLALFPKLLGWLARLVGIQVPANLLFMLALVLLLGVCLQISLEISRVEDRLRVLAENVAILNLQARASGSEELLVRPEEQDAVSSKDRLPGHASPDAQDGERNRTNSE